MRESRRTKSSKVTRILLAAALTGASLVSAADPASAASAIDILQAGAQQGVSENYPGVIGLVRTGSTAQYARAGLGSVGTNADPKAQLRIGSVTKTFVAATILLLEAEGKLSLDDTVAKWLPGVVNANGNDGTRITIRELLNMTSGLPDYITMLPAGWWTSTTQYTDQSIVNLALTARSTGTPGAAVNYTNTAYVVAGMIIKAVTGNSVQTEVQNRVITPLGLTNTAFPTTDRDLHGNYLHGYELPLFWISFGGPPYQDVTSGNITVGPAAGGMVSTEDDLATFYRDLLDGTLLAPQQLRELKTGVQEGTTSNYFALGLESVSTSCGTMWAKDGAVPGFTNLVLTSEDASKQVLVAANEFHLTTMPKWTHLVTAAENAYCAS